MPVVRQRYALFDLNVPLLYEKFPKSDTWVSTKTCSNIIGSFLLLEINNRIHIIGNNSLRHMHSK